MNTPKKVIKISDLLSSADLDLLQEYISLKFEKCCKDEEDVRIYHDKGREFGLIGDSGQLYTDTKQFWEMRDKIITKIHEEKQKAIDLRFKLRN